MSKNEAKCVVCGCTESDACEGGCGWASADPPVCTRCASPRPFDVEDESVSPPGPEGVMGAERGIYEFRGSDEAEEMAVLLNFAFALGRRAGIARALSRLGLPWASSRVKWDAARDNLVLILNRRQPRPRIGKR